MSDGAEHSSGKELAAASVAESNQLQDDELTFTGCFEWVLRWRRGLKRGPVQLSRSPWPQSGAHFISCWERHCAGS